MITYVDGNRHQLQSSVYLGKYQHIVDSMCCIYVITPQGCQDSYCLYIRQVLVKTHMWLHSNLDNLCPASAECIHIPSKTANSG